MKKPEEVTVNLNIHVQGGCRTYGSNAPPLRTYGLNINACKIAGTSPIQAKLMLSGTVSALPGYDESGSPRVFVAWYRFGLPSTLPDNPSPVITGNPASGEYAEAGYNLAVATASNTVDWSLTINVGNADCPDFEFGVVVFVRHESLTEVKWVRSAYSASIGCDELGDCVT